MDQSNNRLPRGSKEHEVEEAMKALTQLFSSESADQRHFCCGVGGPTEFELWFESVCDDLFGHDPNSDYKCFVRRLYEHGFISSMPINWRL
jgi:hypothetical protein